MRRANVVLAKDDSIPNKDFVFRYRLAGKQMKSGFITGRDKDLLPLPVPTADPKRRGGSRLDGSLGLSVEIPGTGVRLAAEGGVPIWQDLEGPQLAAEWWGILGAQFAF